MPGASWSKDSGSPPCPATVLMVVDKQKKTAVVIDVTIPNDSNTKKKERENWIFSLFHFILKCAMNFC